MIQPQWYTNLHDHWQHPDLWSGSIAVETTEIDLIQVYREAGLLSEDQPFLLEASWKEFCQQVAITNSKDSEITRSSSSVVPGGIILAPRTSDTTFQRNQHIRITVTSKRIDTAWMCVQTVIYVSCDGFLESGLLNSIQMGVYRLFKPEYSR